MRALTFGLVMSALSLTLGACAVDASSPVSDEDRASVQHGVGAANGESAAPVEGDGSQGPVRTVQNHKAASVVPGDHQPTSEPAPTPWRGDGSGSGTSSGKGAQKKDGDLHTKMRDSIVPDDGTNP